MMDTNNTEHMLGTPTTWVIILICLVIVVVVITAMLKKADWLDDDEPDD